MIAEQPVDHYAIPEDLDSMSLRELELEQVSIKCEIARVTVQLEDPDRPQQMGPSYRAWRRRAYMAREHLKREKEEIKVYIREKQAESLEAKQTRQALVRQTAKDINRTAHATLQVEAARRRQELVNAIHGNGGAEGLLARVALVLHRLPINSDELAQEDLATLREITLFLRARYGDAAMRAAKNGTLDLDGEASRD